MKKSFGWATLALSLCAADAQNATFTKVENGVPVTVIAPPSTNAQVFVYGEQKTVVPKPKEQTSSTSGRPWNENYAHTTVSTPAPIQPVYNGNATGRYGYSVWNPAYAYGGYSQPWNYGGYSGYSRKGYLGGLLNVETVVIFQSHGGYQPQWTYVPVVPGYTIQTRQGTLWGKGGSGSGSGSGSVFNPNYAEGSSAPSGGNTSGTAPPAAGGVWNPNYATP